QDQRQVLPVHDGAGVGRCRADGAGPRRGVVGADTSGGRTQRGRRLTAGRPVVARWSGRCGDRKGAPARAFVAEVGGRVVRTSYVRPNQPGRGAHVANAGYMVADEARGQGLASALCGHSLETAWRLALLAMQLNFVVSTNAAALRVWEK